MTGTRDLARALADAFSEELQSRLSDENLDELYWRTEEENNSHVCHSHDFCDANEVMLRAGKKVGFEPDLRNERDLAVLNAAWDQAKADRFGWYPKTTTEEE